MGVFDLSSFAVASAGYLAAIAAVAYLDSLIVAGFLFSGTVLFSLAVIALGKEGIEIGYIWAASLAGSFLGDLSSYAFGRLAQRHVLTRVKSATFMRSVTRARALISTYGAIGIVVGRFTWLTRKVVPFTCGTLEFKFSKFIAADALACVIWVTFWSLVLYFSVVLGYDAIRSLFSIS